MAYQSCIDEVQRLAGRELNDTELDQIFSQVQKLVRKYSGEDLANLEQRVLQAVEEQAEDIRAAAVIEKRNAALNLRKRMEWADYLRTTWADRPDLGIEALMAGVSYARPGSRRSVDAAQTSLTANYLEGMMGRLKEADVLKVFVSGEMDRDIWRAMHELGQDVVDRERLNRLPKEAIAAAEILNEYNELARVRANKAGAWIKKLPGRVIKQTHDMFRIRDAGEAEWVEYVSTQLDWERSFPDVEPKDRIRVLTGLYKDFASGVHLKFKKGGPSGFTGFANIGRELSHERVLHFKDADAEFEYQQRFGSGTLAEGMLFGLERMAQDTALMEHFGPNAEATVDFLIAEGAKLIRQAEPKARTKYEIKTKWLKRTLWPNLTGETRVPENHMLAQVSSMVRAQQQMSKLGGAVLSAFPDLAVSASEVRYQGGSLFSGIADALGSLAKNTSSAEYIGALSDMGIMADSVRGAVARFDVSDRVPGRMAKLTQTFFKLSGLQLWTDQLRKGMALTFAHRLAQAANGGWDQMDTSLKRVLSLYNIDAGKWEVLRNATAKALDDRVYLVPEALDDVGDEVFAKYLSANGQKKTPHRISSLREELKGDLRSFYADRSKMAVVEPDAKTRAYLLQGTKPGTTLGEIVRHIALFKSFMTSVIQRPLARELNGYGPEVGGALRRLMANENGELSGLLTFLTVNAALGYVSLAAKDATKGREPRDPLSFDTMKAALVQGGGAGIYGDFLFGEVKNRFGGTFVSTLAGPAFGTVDDLADLWGRMRDGDDAAAAAFRTAINNTPFLNLFYTRGAMDYLLLHRISESLNPGYLRRMERRVEREMDQEYFLPPSEVIPYGGF